MTPVREIGPALGLTLENQQTAERWECPRIEEALAVFLCGFGGDKGSVRAPRSRNPICAGAVSRRCWRFSL